MAPVVRAFRMCGWAHTIVLSTGQHDAILDQTLRDLGVPVDLSLRTMQDNQSLGTLTSRVFAALEPALEKVRPDIVLAQGDTTTVMVAAMLCFYRHTPFGHVEAGLRTFDTHHPFPEELNRVIITRVATLHFAPTRLSRDNLRAEGVPDETISVTGNPGIDTLLKVAEETGPPPWLPARHRVILVTAHRRENFGEPLLRICSAIRSLHDAFPDVCFVYPVHPNPNVRDVVKREFEGMERVTVLPPLGYRALVAVLKAAHLVLTDSGGLQEEAPALGKPVLVLRSKTERPEAVAAGITKTVGTDCDAIFQETKRLLLDKTYYSSIAQRILPFGDGCASARILARIAEHFRVESAAPVARWT